MNSFRARVGLGVRARLDLGFLPITNAKLAVPLSGEILASHDLPADVSRLQGADGPE